MPSRRTFVLGAGAGLAAAAGCLSTGGDGNRDGTPTPEPSDGVSVDDVVVRKAVTYESLMGSGGVLAAEGEQYVVGAVSTDRELSRADFAFEADGESWPPGVSGTAGGRDRSVAGRGNGPLGHAAELDRAFLVFAVPSPLSADGAAIRYDGDDPGTWPLDDDAVARLGAPEPRFELESLEVPSEVRQGAPLEFSMSVRNVSETDGRFLAAVYWPTNGIADDDESHVVERDVSAGEEATISRSIDTEYTAMEDGPVSLRVRGHVEAAREVHVEGTSTPE